jgi:hypothetical protein
MARIADLVGEEAVRLYGRRNEKRTLKDEGRAGVNYEAMPS